jgi:hypothetical protein
MKRPQRYATVYIIPLNGGTGKVTRNFPLREDFEWWYRTMFPQFAKASSGIPDRGIGGIGDSIFSFSWTIYGREQGGN